ncbi:MAG: hypothetical protein IJM14_09390 [Lachnospiraceae bacterium]|nr:hypothetical protein [Lachnospiraceae bacterium]
MTDYEKEAIHDSSDFVLLADMVPGIIQEIRYFSTYNFIGERILPFDLFCFSCHLRSTETLT